VFFLRNLVISLSSTRDLQAGNIRLLKISFGQ